MYLGSWKIDDYLTFACNTHRFDTGGATDADAAPSYRVYEDETATPILTGTLALLDSVNTAGLYSERVQLTAASGLEKGKTYTIYISATVNSVEGTMSHTFQMEAEVDANVVSDTSVAQASTALTNVTWTDAKAAFIDHSIATVDTSVDTLLTRITAARAGYLDNLSAGSVALASALVTAQTDLDIITGTDGVTLATLQALYAPNKVVPDIAGIAAGLHSTTDGLINVVDGIVDNILVDTGTTIPGTISTMQGNVTDILTDTGTSIPGTIAIMQADLDNPDQYKADVSALATAANLATVDTVVDAIKLKTDNLPTDPADQSLIMAGINGLNDLSAAQVNTECDTALIDYGGPTRAEATTDKDAIITEVNANEAKIDIIDTNVDTIKTKTDNLPDGIKKNTAIQAFTFLMVDSADHVTGKTGLTVDGYYSGDGGVVSTLSNTGAITEISNGLYEIDLTAGELNYNNVTLIFTATGADARVITIHTSA